MAHYIGPKSRINRRLGFMVYESAGAVRVLEKREGPPGMHGRSKRTSNYGAALAEKQRIKHYYGLNERQLRRYFHAASAMKGNTGENLLLMCERRLDNIVRRAGFAKTRPQARQSAAHGHFTVNGVKVNSPSFELRPGDVIAVRGRENLQGVFKGFLAANTPDPPDWLTVDTDGLRITVAGAPGPEDISLKVAANVVVEFLSR